QYLQLREGPRRPPVRVRATSCALAALAREAVLPAEHAAELAESYGFLRRLENRLRIVHDRSIEEIPADPTRIDRLARRMGYHAGGQTDSPGARLLADYRAHTE